MSTLNHQPLAALVTGANAGLGKDIAGRRQPHEGQLRVLVGKERFSENHAWSEMPQHWPACLAGRAMIEVVGQGRLEARLDDGGPPVDVVVPMWSPLPGRAIRAGSFGLIQQFGVGSTTSTLMRPPTKGCGSPTCPALTPCLSPSTPWPSSSRWRDASTKPRTASSQADGVSPLVAHSPAR